MKRSKLDKPRVSKDTLLYGVFSTFSVFKQAWHLNQCSALNFELIPNPYQLYLAKHTDFSLHHIFYSCVFEHFSVWLIENQGNLAYLSGVAPRPQSFLVIKGDASDEEIELIEKYLNDKMVFSLKQKYEYTNFENVLWLLDIETYIPMPATNEMANLKRLKSNLPSL